jgi:hypothetical protein
MFFNEINIFTTKIIFVNHKKLKYFQNYAETTFYEVIFEIFLNMLSIVAR